MDSYGTYDDPPSTETSTPRSRREGLHRAIRNTSFLARSEGSNSMSANDPRRPRSTLLSPINRRRYRSPSNTWEQPSDTQANPNTSPRRSKRRKLDNDHTNIALVPPIKYGHFGQVEAGTLKLDLVSCDGGDHVDPRSPGLYLGVKNVLEHNKSVYCSERSSANIVLKHADDTTFALEKLHIVGPEHGFTAPVREGVVYIAMTLNDLQKYLDPPPHARRMGAHSPPYQRRRQYINGLRSSPERLSLSDALRDPHIDAALGRTERSYARVADSANDLATAGDGYYGEDFGFGRTDPEAHCDIPVLEQDGGDMESRATSFEAGEHDWNVPVTVLSDDEVGPEEVSSQEVLDFRLQRSRAMRRRLEMEQWDREDGRWTPNPTYNLDDTTQERGNYGAPRWPRNSIPPPNSSVRARAQELWERHHANLRRPLISDHFNPLRTINRDTTTNPSHFNDSSAPAPPPPPPAEPETRTQARATEPKDPNITCAHFSIKPGKHKVAIKFDPAISGRFILIRLWSGPSDNTGRAWENVDVQSLVAKGFGGCRFFPAREGR
ncbi:hypothetical protein LTR62_001577 [Meristemomyces frigidus]|uniref:Uncharacterized protein n=1 Tax=Meristemomyces frigidus TaxID=1508187 RepID=A0AAN7T982_9PEZI|nr:hypothetical protein LTR62_001577 [Meristemomyces frigidus]